ncbi:MAG: hypothetical protein Q7J09_10790 [Methanocalculus sp.]|nr:hypothetical protein [Methanocalculus sp.]MDO9540469.1 hypothetical protein [Methanocalculus sp.]
MANKTLTKNQGVPVATKEIQKRMIGNLTQADQKSGKHVAKEMKLA